MIYLKKNYCVQIQLVVKQGNTEIKLTGHFTDFDDTTLTAKNIIDEVNADIKVIKIQFYFYINIINNL